MNKDCRYLLDTLEYNPEFHKGIIICCLLNLDIYFIVVKSFALLFLFAHIGFYTTGPPFFVPEEDVRQLYGEISSFARTCFLNSTAER